MSIVLDLHYPEWSGINEREKNNFEARYAWCRQKASEYLAAKERKKYYYIQYYDPYENIIEGYNALPQEVVDNLRKELEQSVIDDGPFKDKKEEIEQRREIIKNMSDPYIESPDQYQSVCADVCLYDIDPDNFIYDYKLIVCCFDPISKSLIKDEKIWVELSDEEYIQILTELLCAPFNLSFDGLRMVEPNICNRIIKQYSTSDYATAIFLTEMNEDVQNILEQCGGRDKIPESQYISNFWDQSSYDTKYNSI